MGLETASTIAALVPANPVATDPVSQGDDHLRLIKTVLQLDAAAKSAANTFVDGQVFGTATFNGQVTMTSVSVLAAMVIGGALTANAHATISALTVMGIASFSSIAVAAPNSISTADINGNFLAPVLIATGVSAGTYTSATIVVDAKGRLTSAAAGGAGGGVTSVNGRTGVVTISTADVTAGLGYIPVSKDMGGSFPIGITVSATVSGTLSPGATTAGSNLTDTATTSTLTGTWRNVSSGSSGTIWVQRIA